MDLVCILLFWYGCREGYLYGVKRKWFGGLSDKLIRVSPYIFLTSIFAYFTYFSALNYFSYEFLNLFDRDFPANVQAIWKLSEGLYPYATIFQKHYLADHWWPIFWFISLPYKLFPSPLTILFLNLFGFFIALVALFFLFFKNTKHNFLAYALCVNLALHPYVQMALVGRSNSDIYSFVFMSLAFCFYFYKNYIGYFIFLVAAFLCKEDVPLYFAAAGLWIVFIEKNRKIGWGTFFISVIYFIGVTKVLMPHYNDSVNLMNFSRYYDYLGSSIDEIILNIFMKPWLVVGQVLSFSSIISLIFLFGPVLGFVLFSGSSVWLLLVPIFIKLLIYNVLYIIYIKIPMNKKKIILYAGKRFGNLVLNYMIKNHRPEYLVPNLDDNGKDNLLHESTVKIAKREGIKIINNKKLIKLSKKKNG